MNKHVWALGLSITAAGLAHADHSATALQPVVLEAQTAPAVSPFAVYASRRASATPILPDSAPVAVAQVVSPTVVASPIASTAPALPAPAPSTVITHSPVLAAPAPVAHTPGCCPTAAPVVTYRPVAAAPAAQGDLILGTGLIGQPKVYVSGQPIRNFFRYLSP